MPKAPRVPAHVRRLSSLGELRLINDPWVSGDDGTPDKDEEAAVLAAELEETMSRAGSEWSNLAWYGEGSEGLDLRKYELRKVSGFTFARPRVSVLVDRVKEAARENRDKASAFVDRRVQRTAEATSKLNERREAALAIIRRAAQKKKKKMSDRAAKWRRRSTSSEQPPTAGSSRAPGAMSPPSVLVELTARSASLADRTSPIGDGAPPRLLLTPSAVELDTDDDHPILDEHSDASTTTSWRVVEAPLAPAPAALAEPAAAAVADAVPAAAAEVVAPTTLPAKERLDDDVEPAAMAAAVAASAHILHPSRWEQPTEAPPVRGPSYFDDGKKIAAVGGPLCTLFATQVFELDGEHLAGASARLLQAGSLVPPASARFVLSVHFMTPRPGKGAKHHSIMAHSYATTAADDAPGPTGDLLRELWGGDAANAITRCKVLSALKSGPQLVRATMSWMGLDETRPMLLARQIATSVNRARLPHPSGHGATFEHVEIAFDCADSPLCRQMYKYAWPSLPSIALSLTLLLEARETAHLPEHPLVACALHNIQPSELAAQPPEWPSEPSEIPGQMHGSYFSGRAAEELGSWQSNRQIVTNLKSATKGGAKRGWFE